MRLKPNRRYPSLPDTDGSQGSIAELVRLIKEAMEVGERRQGSVLDSFVRVRDLVDMEIIKVDESTGIVTGVDKGYIFPVWAEENSTIQDGTYEWAFGNGANTQTGSGVVIYIPPRHEGHVVAMSLVTGSASGTSTVEAEINGTLQGSACNVTLSSERSTVNDTFAPVPIATGDVLNFRTTTGGTSAPPCVVTAWIRVRPAL